MLTANWPFLAGATSYRMKFEYDGNNNQIYIGWSRPGLATSDTGWRLMKQTFNASSLVTDIEWPQGSPAFNFIWDQRSTYAYS